MWSPIVQNNHMRKPMFGVLNSAPDEHLIKDASRPLLDKNIKEKSSLCLCRGVASNGGNCSVSRACS